MNFKNIDIELTNNKINALIHNLDNDSVVAFTDGSYNNKKDRKHETDFIDMIGIRIYRTHLTIRKRVFKRTRRVCIGLYRFWKLHQKIPIHLARKAISYYGLIKNTNSYKIKKKYHVNKIIQLSKGVIRNESTFYVGAAFCQSY